MIWEEHQERVDKELEYQIPTFKALPLKTVLNNKKNKYNFLLEGDNLHSLYLLEKTHKEKIDLIIIDPPYNTGSNDFMYGDSYLEIDDEYKHSKWLSFMSRRLAIAKRLLNDNGLIFINIDDNEQAELRLLCDDIFGENNFVNCICVKMSEPTGVKMSHCDKRLPKLKEYILMYKKNNINLKNIQIPKEKWDDEYKILLKGIEKQELEHLKTMISKGNLNETEIKKCDGICKKITFGSVNELFDKNLSNVEKDKIKYDNAWRIVRDVATAGGAKKLSDEKRKVNKYNSFIIKTPQNKVYLIKNGYNESTPQPRIKLLFADQYLTNNPCDLWQDIKTTGLDNEGYVTFLNGKKPLKLVERIIELANNKNAMILDFFAGSGTTGEAVINMNKQDNGNRKFILCTNNESGICENITYKRIIKSISKYNEENLLYYKTSYIPRINNDEENLSKNLMINIKNLIQLENGIEIDDIAVKIILSEEEIDRFTSDKNQLNNCEKLYIFSDILLTSKQNQTFKEYNIELFTIPEYYFEDEIREVA